ncbi:MAG TPA: hypothetical protein VF810_04220 [Patescibacteria group bacterium]
MKYKIVFFIVMVAIISIFAVFIFSSKPVLQITKIGIASTPTPFPFQEITIPYLRARTYSSQLGQLEKYSETQNYTAYLTLWNTRLRSSKNI